MTFLCNGCNRDIHFDHLQRAVITKENEFVRYCRACCSPKTYVPDVYWDGKPEENLADDPRTGKPIVFSSKGEKAAYLKSRGIAEAGDRVHGAPVELHRNQERKVDSEHEVKMALKHVREMGRDVRRQAYLKILKEGRRYA